MENASMDKVPFSVIQTHAVVQGSTEKRKAHPGYAILQ